jgi:hypothetical protein
MKAYGGGGIDPNFLDLGTIWGWVVSSTSKSIYPKENNPTVLIG